MFRGYSRADQANLAPALGVNHCKNSPSAGHAKRQPAHLANGMVGVGESEFHCVPEYGGRFFEADFMLLEILRGFYRIGFKFHESLFHVQNLLSALQAFRLTGFPPTRE